MSRVLRTPLLAAAWVLALAPAAQADPLIIPAPGAKNLTAIGGWRAWAAPKTGGRWQIVTRTPDGGIQPADIADFEVLPDPSIGWTALAGPARRLVIVYSRCEGSSVTQGCDVFQYDVAAGTERKVTRISTAKGSETAPSVVAGSYAFARRGGPRPGTYSANRTHVRRIDSRVARETALTPSRVAFRTADGVTLRWFDGRHRHTLTTSPYTFGVVITCYRVGWLQGAGHRTLAFMTDRINPSGGVTIHEGAHDLPASTQSAVADSSGIVEYLGATGIKRADPPLFPAGAAPRAKCSRSGCATGRRRRLGHSDQSAGRSEAAAMAARCSATRCPCPMMRRPSPEPFARHRDRGTAPNRCIGHGRRVVRRTPPRSVDQREHGSGFRAVPTPAPG